MYYTKKILADKFVKLPRCKADWLEIARDFVKIWNLTKVVGALDRKLYHNYKGFFSLVLFAICDANYCFTLVDIGQFGSSNGNGVLANSSIGKLFEENRMKLPAERHVPRCLYTLLPYYLFGDEIFLLKRWLMKPFLGKLTKEQCVYSYGHSRPRLVIKNSFGILRA